MPRRDGRGLFYAFRYLVTPSDRQHSMIHEWEKASKEELMLRVFDDLMSKKKSDFLIKKKRFIVYGIQRKRNEVYVLKFAKEVKTKRYVEGPLDVEVKPNDGIGFIYLFVDPTRQIVLVQKKAKVFSGLETGVKYFETFLQDRMTHHHYTVKLQPLANTDKFWEAVATADGIYELSLTLNAPNMLFGSNAIREQLDELQKETNNDQVTIKLENRDGNLHVDKNIFGRFLEYIFTVGGRSKLVRRVGDSIETRTNLDDIKSTRIDADPESTISDEEMKNISDKMKHIHNGEQKKDDDKTG
jgi:hypothetical protein